MLLNLSLATALAMQGGQVSVIPAEIRVPYLSQMRHVGSSSFVDRGGWHIQINDEPLAGISVDLLNSLLVPQEPQPFGLSAGATSLIVDKQSATATRTFKDGVIHAKQILTILHVFPNSRSAQSYFEELYNPKVSQLANPTRHRAVNGNLPSRVGLGEAYWIERERGIVVRQGRVVVQILCSWNEESDTLPVTETLARSMLYRILQHPEISGSRHSLSFVTIRDKRLPVTLMNGVAMVRLADLKNVGITISYAMRDGRAGAQLLFDSQRVRIGAYTRSYNVNGTNKPFTLPSLLYLGDVVVPLKSVAASLHLDQ